MNSIRIALLAAILVCIPAHAQDPNASDREQDTFTGTVVSSTRNTLVVRNSAGRYQLFVLERRAGRTVTPTGSQVTVASRAGDEPAVRIATAVTVVSGPPSGTQANTSPVPPEVHRIERDIERQARRYQLGVRAGVGLDPELLMVGVHAQVGPFFSPDIFLRPSVEFGFGEVTALFGLNLEAIYRLPITSRQGRWTSYVGAGPGFNFIHQNFDKTTNSGKRIDFGDFHSDTGLNILGGLRYRSGTFLELKTSVYTDSAPTLRLIVGYNF
jgi:RNase P/RNase MRP subunit p29